MIKFEANPITHAVSCTAQGNPTDLICETMAMLHAMESDPKFLELVEMSKQLKDLNDITFETYDRLNKKWTERKKS